MNIMLKNANLKQWRTFLEDSRPPNPNDKDLPNQYQYVCEAFLELLNLYERK